MSKRTTLTPLKDPLGLSTGRFCFRAALLGRSSVALGPGLSDRLFVDRVDTIESTPSLRCVFLVARAMVAKLVYQRRYRNKPTDAKLVLSELPVLVDSATVDEERGNGRFRLRRDVLPNNHRSTGSSSC
jgi:hypothetical protein